MPIDDSSVVLKFADAAKRYCGLVEDIDKADGFTFLDKFAEILAELYLKAQRLPVGEAFLDHDGANPISDEQYAGICSRITGKFGYRSYYWLTLNPHVREEVGCGSLGDDLADIYRDLKEYIASYDSGSPRGMAEAAWYWKFSFMSHWGYHAADALRVIHWLMFG